MSRRRSALSLWVVVAAALTSPAVVSAKVFDKVLLTPTADRVRVQAALTADAPVDGVELRATITPTGGGAPLWQGTLGQAKGGALDRTVEDLKPKLWSPGSPALYNVTVRAVRNGREVDSTTQRVGFRTVESKNGQIHLNGHPIFLKGIAINPPERDVPDAISRTREFAYGYVKSLRAHNVNLIRMNLTFRRNDADQVWFDACDELGMLVYQGDYGAPPAGTGERSRGGGGKAVDPEEQNEQFAGKKPAPAAGEDTTPFAPDQDAAESSKTAPPKNFDASMRAYQDVFETYLRHPSIIVYVLSNELPWEGKRGAAWHDYLTKAHGHLRQWDSTRLFIANAGYGQGKEGDINDVHRYWGWYYNTFLTYYNLRQAHEIYGEKGAVQPFTFSECVGSFTSPLGSFNAIYRKQLAPQLGWTGHGGDQKGLAEGYQSFMVKHALESFRTMREQNPRLAGLMPFTILYYNWAGITSAEQMKPKPALVQMGVSYQPVLLSWECWTSQVYGGTKVRAVAHVVNDAEDFSALSGAKLHVELTSAAGKKAVLSKTVDLPDVAYFGAKAVPVELEIPDVPTGDYVLSGRISRGGKDVSANQFRLYVENSLKAEARPWPEDVAIYDPSGKTIEALHRPMKRITSLDTIPDVRALVIGEAAFDKPTALPAVKAFVAGGGRVLLFGQDYAKFDPSWLPVGVKLFTTSANDTAYLDKLRPTYDQMNVNPERPDHPVFAGLDRSRFHLWSDYSGWDQSKAGFPQVYPVTRGFKITKPEDMAKTAILANYDRGLEGIALCEMFEGKGSVIFTGLDLVGRAGLDPVADRMMDNLVHYAISGRHELYPLVDKPIEWGNYPTERGVLTGPWHGLVYNCRWVPSPTAPDAKPLADNTGAWNTKPGNAFVPMGLRAVGPGFEWNSGASPKEPKTPEGTGFFYCRVPEGRRQVVSRVENPGKEPQRMAVEVNGTKGEAVTVEPGKTVTLVAPIAGTGRDVMVRYTGGRQLVVLRTEFK
jgi:hypothetical protein